MSTLTATAEPANSPPRVLLNLNMADLTPDPAEATILRQDPDGRTRPVRLAEPATLTAGAWQGYDYEAPFGLAVTYSASSVTPVGSATSSAVTLDVATAWLRHPGIPSLSVELALDRFRKDSFGTRSRPASRAVFTPLGRSDPVVVTSGARRTVESQMVLRTDTAQQRDELWSLVDDESVLLLDIPPGEAWGVAHEYISVGDVAEVRMADWGDEPRRWFPLPYLVVERPAGGLQAQYTWADVLADHATWADVRSRYDTWADVLANARNDA